VQEKLWQQKELVWEVLGKKGGAIYVCGSASRVGKSVKEVVISILAHFYQMNANERENNDTEAKGDSSAVVWAEQFLERLMTEKKYCEEVWG
jgi:cytochrome P450/NADPH-cytochrome P450 reductase